MGQQIDPQDLAGPERQRESDKGTDQHDEDLRSTAGQAVDEEAPDVVVDAPAFLDGRDHGRQVIIGEDEVGRLSCDLRSPLPHRHTDVGPAQGRAVVDAVAGHGRDRASSTPGVDDIQLLLRVRPGEHPCCGEVDHAPRCQIRATEHRFVTAVSVNESHASGHRACCGGVIARNKDWCNPRCTAGRESGGRRRFRGSLMATRPSSRRPVSAVAALLGSFRRSVDATASTRNPREARIDACCRAPINTSFRLASTDTSRTTSGAPFKHTSRAPEDIRCTVVMRLRRLSNGASHLLGYSRLISA